MECTAVVLCGGASRRFGSDKTRALVDGRPLLDLTLQSLPPWPIVVVGPERPTDRAVEWTRERPVFAGPLAGLAAGLTHLATPAFVVVGADMPGAGIAAADLLAHLDSTGPDVDAVVARTPDGRLQPLLLACRAPAAAAAMPTDPTGASLMSWVRRLRTEPHGIAAHIAADIDTPADLAVRNRRKQ